MLRLSNQNKHTFLLSQSWAGNRPDLIRGEKPLTNRAFFRAWHQLYVSFYFRLGCLDGTIVFVGVSKAKFKHHLCCFSFSASVEVFLRFLQKEYQWSTTSVKTISSRLAKDDITSVRLLAMCWKEAQDSFPIGMRKMIEKELRKRNMVC